MQALRIYHNKNTQASEVTSSVERNINRHSVLFNDYFFPRIFFVVLLPTGWEANVSVHSLANGNSIEMYYRAKYEEVIGLVFSRSWLHKV